MKHTYRKIFTIAILTMVVVFGLAAQAAIEQQNVVETPVEAEVVETTEAVAGTQTEDQTSDMADGILYMREEEKLARDVYLALYDIWGIRTFANIANSEQQHMDAVAYLINVQGLVDPAAQSATGEFQNPVLAKLYTDLVAQGSKSIVDALKVGATIEDLDINDLENLIVEIDDPDTLAVYGNLLRGSENHMRSFTGQLSRYGVVYTPQFITAERLSSIIGR